MPQGRLTPNDFEKALGDCKAGRRVRLTFARNAIDDLGYFLGMFNCSNPLFDVSVTTMVTLMAVQESGQWEMDKNRIVEIELTSAFDRDWFEGRMARALDKIEHVG